LATSDLDPLLNNGITLASLRAVGNSALEKEWLIISESGKEISVAICFMTEEESWSSPVVVELSSDTMRL
jgi:hypothetical protein